MPEGQPDNPELLIQAAQNGQLDEVRGLVEIEMAGFFLLDRHSSAAMVAAAANGRLEIVEYLLGIGVNPDYQFNAALREAARNGHLEMVEYLLGFDSVNPADLGNQAIILAAENGHLEVVERFLACDEVNPADQDSRAVGCAIRNGYLEVVRALLADGRVTFQLNDINEASSRGHEGIAYFFGEYLTTPKGQMAFLISAHQAVLLYEGERGLSGRESSMDVYLERQARRQQTFLSERYAEESLSSGQCLLRELVFRALQSHIQNNTPEAEEKLRFLSEHMNDLIVGDTKFLTEAAALFNSNEDIYEIASRAVNTQAQVMKDPSGNDIWPNLLTAEGEAGKWTQDYAGNIAREIAASEGQAHHDTCLSALIYRLAEIRRAHNEGDVIGTDNPSCFPGTKTRLLKVLESHPEHSQYVKPEWKTACYEGAARHIEQTFKELLDEIDSPEEAEQLLDALLMMRLENREAIHSGQALLTISGDRRVYDEEDCQRRLVFIDKVEEGLHAAVNAYLVEEEQEPLSEEDGRNIYLCFLGFALGEEWIAPRLSSVYSQHAPKVESEDDLEDVSQAVLNLRVAAQARQQQAALQGLKRRFYEYCEQHYPEVEVSAGPVNAFFAGVEMPSETDETAFFEDAFKQLASDESNEGRQSPSP